MPLDYSSQDRPVHRFVFCILVASFRLRVVIGGLAETRYLPGSEEPIETSTRSLPAGPHAWCRPKEADIHRVGSVGRQTAVSIHVYGNRFDEVCRSIYEDHF